MIQQIASGQDRIALPYLAPNAMIYTDQVLTCDSCKEKYESGFLVEMQGVGLFCLSCFRSAFEEYFNKNPGVNYMYTRGVCSLAHQGKAMKR